MKTALIVGATGLVGKYLTIKLLNADFYDKVKVLVRKDIEIQHEKLEQIIVDFEKLDGSKIIADDIFCCLGTTMAKAGSKEAFYKVDATYPLEIATFGLKNGAKQFAIVTALGANQHSIFYYSRVKGDVEKALADLHFPTLLIFRPSMLLGEREEKRTGEKIGTFIMKTFDFLIPKKYKGVQAEKVADSMLKAAQKNLLGTYIFENFE